MTESSRRFIALSFMFHSAGGAVGYFVFPLYIYSISGRFSYVGIAFSLPFLLFTVFSYLLGWFSDRIGNRKIVLFAGLMVEGAIYPFFIFVHDPWMAIALRSVQYAFSASQVLYTTMASEYMPWDKDRAIASVQTFSAIGATWGSLAGGGLIYLLPMGYAPGFIFSAIMTLLAAVIVPLARESFSGRKVNIRIRYDPALRPVYRIGIISAILFTGDYLVLAVFPNYLKSLGLSDFVIGVFVAISSFTSIFSAHYSPEITRRFGIKSSYRIAVVMYIFITLGYALATSPILLLILWTIPLWNFFMVVTSTLSAYLTEESRRGEAMGILMGSLSLGSLLGSFFSGFLIDALGFRNGFIIAALVMVPSAVLSWFWGPDVVGPERMDGDDPVPSRTEETC